MNRKHQGDWIFNFLLLSLQNTALNLASFHGHDEIVKYLLSLKNQEILMNAFNQNVLDIALNEEKKDVAMVIAEHVRYM